MPIVVAKNRSEIKEAHKPYQPYGAAEALLYDKSREILLSGPAGTGKSRAILEKLFLVAEKYPRCRILILRKTRASLTEAALVTFEEKVVPAGHSCLNGATRQNRASYRFPNGSKIIIGGLDKANKVMSTEYDIIYIQEAIEVTDDDLEKVTTRLRNGVLPYQQLLMDTNPDGPRHWLKLRCERGQTKMVESRHEDNPVYFDQVKKTLTTRGRAYIQDVLDKLTGVRFKRLRHGLWVAAEGLVYEHWDPAIHRIDRSSIKIPRDWPRYWGVDFGMTNPFVWQNWVKGSDGDLYRTAEIYRTNRLVEDHCADIMEYVGWKHIGGGRHEPIREKPEPLPRAVICDHDAEDRATFERHTGLETIGAYKAVTAGIQAVAERLGRPRIEQEDGTILEAKKSRIFWFRDALIHPRDPRLEEKKRPCSSEEEFDGYVWDTSKNDQGLKEKPLKKDDHAKDEERYVVAYVDDIAHTVQEEYWDIF